MSWMNYLKNGKSVILCKNWFLWQYNPFNVGGNKGKYIIWLSKQYNNSKAGGKGGKDVSWLL